MNNLLGTEPHDCCDICGSQGELLYSEARDLLFGVPGTFSYRRCLNPECRLIWQDPMICQHQAERAYVNYYTHAAEAMKKKGFLLRRLARVPAHLLDSILLKVWGIKKVRKEMRYMGLKSVSPGSLLEVGCGRGDRLAFFQNMGWQVSGQEIDPKAAEYVQKTYGIEVLCGDLVDLHLEAGKYDAIIMSHVIEHVFDIPGYLRECYRLLKPGGRLIITTPNSASLAHKKFGENWRGLEPPRHIHIFSLQNLQRALRLAGFEQVEMRTNAATSRGVFEASYQLRDNGKLSQKEYPSTAVYYKSIYYQYREWLDCRGGRDSGEELQAIAQK